MTGFAPSRRFMLALPAIMVATPSLAADDLVRSIDALMRKAVPEAGGGAAVAVVKDGQVLFQGGYGLAVVEHGMKVQPDTVFHIASCSKQFAALSIALLVQDGMVKLDEDVRTYLPDLPDYGQRIEVQNMLHHTSGICDQWAAMAVAGWRDGDIFTQPDVNTVLHRIRTLNFKPGTKFDYSNGGYTLLATIVERVSGMSMRQFGQRRIFGPLGMTRTFWRDDVDEVTPGRALSYTVKDGKARYLPLNFATYGATGLNTTVEDLVRWDAAFYGGSIFSPAVIEMATTPRPLADGTPNPYCFGLVKGSYRGLPTFGHAGADAGFRANIARFPEQRFSVQLLCNNDTIDFTGLLPQIADLVLDGLFTQPSPPMSGAMGAPAAGGDAITDDAANRLTGTYAAPDGRAYYIVRSGTGLALDSDDGSFGLIPLGGGRFRSDLLPAVVEFTGDAGSRAAALQMASGQSKVVATRQPDVAYSAADLAAMAGTYRSPEVDTVLHFIPAGPTLAMRGLKLNQAALPIYKRDLFGANDGMKLRVRRDGSGRVTGMVMSMPHLNALPFDRIA